MLSAAAQWAGNFFETVAAVGLVLLAGTIAAAAAFWIFRRVMAILAGPEEVLADQPEDDTHTDPGSSI